MTEALPHNKVDQMQSSAEHFRDNCDVFIHSGRSFAVCSKARKRTGLPVSFLNLTKKSLVTFEIEGCHFLKIFRIFISYNMVYETYFSASYNFNNLTLIYRLCSHRNSFVVLFDQITTN